MEEMAIKTERVVISTTTILINLKSNTMKNTMQKYCFFSIWPNILVKKWQKYPFFLNFVNSTLQNNPFLSIFSLVYS